MKKSRFILAIFLIAAFFITIPTSALAIAYDVGETAVLLSEEQIAELDPDDFELVSTEVRTYTVVTDENHNLIDIYEGTSPISLLDNSHTWNFDYATIYLNFYKSGSTYYVSMSAQASNGWWFTEHELKIRPLGNSGWFTHNNDYDNQPATISDLMYFSYPDGAPANVTVEVDGYFAVRSTGVLDHSYYWPWAITMSDP